MLRDDDLTRVSVDPCAAHGSAMSDDILGFGPFTLDRVTLELRHDGEPVALEPLPTRLLVRLAETPGSLTPRKELVTLGWPGTLPSLGEQSLNTCIYQIRRALAVSESAAVELETLRGRGYRLVVRSGAGRAAQRGSRPTWLAPVAGALAAAVLAAIVGLPPDGSVPEGARPMLERAQYLAFETGDLLAARAVLDSARALFPESARTHAEWAELSVWLADYERASRAARRALALEPRSATAHRTLAIVAMVRSDWSGADAELGTALAMDPADTRTHAALAWLRLIQRRFEDARRLFAEALAIDPMSATLYRDVGLGHLLMGRYEDAARYCRDLFRFRPRSIPATDCLFDAMVLAGHAREAAHWGRRLLMRYGAVPPSDGVPPQRVVAAVEAWRLGRWTTAVERGAYPFGLALAHAANGNREEALEALRGAVDDPRLGVLTMAVDPRLASLRPDPGFRQLEARLRLPQREADGVSRGDVIAGRVARGRFPGRRGARETGPPGPGRRSLRPRRRPLPQRVSTRALPAPVSDPRVLPPRCPSRLRPVYAPRHTGVRPFPALEVPHAPHRSVGLAEVLHETGLVGAAILLVPDPDDPRRVRLVEQARRPGRIPRPKHPPEHGHQLAVPLAPQAAGGREPAGLKREGHPVLVHSIGLGVLAVGGDPHAPDDRLELPLPGLDVAVRRPIRARTLRGPRPGRPPRAGEAEREKAGGGEQHGCGLAHGSFAPRRICPDTRGRFRGRTPDHHGESLRGA